MEVNGNTAQTLSMYLARRTLIESGKNSKRATSSAFGRQQLDTKGEKDHSTAAFHCA